MGRERNTERTFNARSAKDKENDGTACYRGTKVTFGAAFSFPRIRRETTCRHSLNYTPRPLLQGELWTKEAKSRILQLPPSVRPLKTLDGLQSVALRAGVLSEPGPLRPVGPPASSAAATCWCADTVFHW